MSAEVPATEKELLPELAFGIERVRRMSGESADFFHGLTGAQLNWKPAKDRWSVGENVLHVNSVNRFYLDEIEVRIREARTRRMLSEGPFRYGWFNRWFLQAVEPPVKRRYRAPKLFTPEAKTASREDLDEFRSSLERLESAMRAASGVDLTRVKVRSPASKWLRFSLGAALGIAAAHTERHLIQAMDVAKEPSFPAGERP